MRAKPSIWATGEVNPDYPEWAEERIAQLEADKEEMLDGMERMDAENAKLTEAAKAVVDEHEAMVSEWGGSDTIDALAALLEDK